MNITCEYKHAIQSLRDLDDLIFEEWEMTRETSLSSQRGVEQYYKCMRDPSLWTEALTRMASTHEFAGTNRSFDFAWARHVAIGGDIWLARPQVTQEANLMKRISTPWPEWDTYGPDCFSRLVAHVASCKQLDSTDTLEWLLVAAAARAAISKHSIAEAFKPIVFKCLVKWSESLPLDPDALDGSADTWPSSVWFHTGNPYVWTFANKIPRACHVEVPEVASIVEAREPLASWSSWISWMTNLDLPRVQHVWGEASKREPILAARTWSSLVPRTSWIATGRQMQNVECGYKDIPEWHMLDDPMRAIARQLPTWENTVHPLCELVLLPMLHWPTSSYLACRLGAWLQDSYVSMSHRDTSAQSLEAMVKPRLESQVKQAFMIIQQPTSPGSSDDVPAQCEPTRAVEPMGDNGRVVSVNAENNSVQQPAGATVAATGLSSPASAESHATMSSTPSSGFFSRLKRQLAAHDTSAKKPRAENIALSAALQEVAQEIQQAKSDKPSSETMMQMACRTMMRRGWSGLLSQLPKISLDTWQSDLGSLVPFTWQLAKESFQDFCTVSRLVPTFVLMEESNRIDAIFETMMGAERPCPEISWGLDASIYWVVSLAKHQSVAPMFRKKFLAETELSMMSETIASSLASSSLLFAQEAVQRTAHHWSSKTVQVWSLLGGMAAARLEQEHSQNPGGNMRTGLLVLYLLSTLAKDAWIQVDNEPNIWRRALLVLTSNRDTTAMRSIMSRVNSLLNKVCQPTHMPEETGVLWKEEHVQDLCDLCGVEWNQAEIILPESRVTRVSLASSAWSRLSRKSSRPAQVANSKKVLPTLEGVRMFFKYMDQLVNKTIPFASSTREILASELSATFLETISLEHVTHEWYDARVAPWLVWIERESYFWLDSENFVLGAKMSLYGDHPWVRSMYWQEFIGRPWSNMSRIAGKE